MFRTHMPLLSKTNNRCWLLLPTRHGNSGLLNNNINARLFSSSPSAAVALWNFMATKPQPQQQQTNRHVMRSDSFFLLDWARRSTSSVGTKRLYSNTAASATASTTTDDIPKPEDLTVIVYDLKGNQAILRPKYTRKRINIPVLEFPPSEKSDVDTSRNLSHSQTFLIKTMFNSDVRTIDRALEAYKSLRNESVRLTVVEFAHLFNLACRAKQPQTVFQLYSDMLADGVRPTSFCIWALIFASAVQSDLSGGLTYWKLLEEYGIPKNLYVYNALIYLYSKCSRVNEMMDAYRQMLQDGIPPIPWTYSCIVSTLTSVGDVDRCYYMCEAMLKDGIFDDNTILRRGFVAGTILYQENAMEIGQQRAAEILENHATRMIRLYVKYGIPMATADCNALMILYSTAQLLEQSEDLFAAMGQEGVKRDAYSLLPLVSLFYRKKNYKMGAQLFEKYCLGTPPLITPDTKLVNEYLWCSVRLRDINRALLALRLMDENSIPPDTVTFTALLQLCIVTHQYDLVPTIVDMISRNKLIPDLPTYNLLMVCGGYMHRPELVKAIYQHMLASNVQPNEYVVGTIVGVLAGAGKTDEAMQILMDAVPKGLANKGYTSMIDACTALNDKESAQQIYEVIKQDPNCTLPTEYLHLIDDWLKSDPNTLLSYELQKKLKNSKRLHYKYLSVKTITTKRPEEPPLQVDD